MQPVYKQKSFLCNKCKVDVEPAIQQTSTVSKASLWNFWNHWSIDFESWKLFLADIGYFGKLLSNH